MTVAVAACLALLAPAPAQADCLIKVLCKDQTPTPSPSPSPSTSPKPKPKPGPSTAPNGSTQPDGSGPAPALPGAVRFVLDTVNTARNTQKLIDLLMRLQPAGVPPSVPQMARGFGRFPVVGYVWYQDDYGAPRYTPYFHLHEGIDLFAVKDTPVIATTDGVIEKIANGSIGGVSLWLRGDDGITYYYGHMSGYARNVVAGLRVRLGDVIGYVGDSGVAQGTYPHLQFEVHPGGGPPVSPKRALDVWLGNAENGAISAYQRLVEYNALNKIGGAKWQAMFDLLREPAAPVPALWQVAVDPVAGALGFDLAFERLAWGAAPASTPSAPSFEGLAAPWQNPLWSVGSGAVVPGAALASVGG